MAVFDRNFRIFTAVLIVAAGGTILGSLEFSGPLVSPMAAGLLGKYLSYAVLALAVDLVWGYMGVLSLGHGAFFALGGYAFGMHLMRRIGARGVYADAVLPDFMVFIGWEKLPWYWQGTDYFFWAVFLAAAVPGALALVFSWTAFRSRVSGVYFSIMSQALTYALMLAFGLNSLGFGGNNGFTDFKTLLGFDLRTPGAAAALCAASAGLLFAAVLAARLLASSRLGLVMRAVRDNELRVRLAGYQTENVKAAVFAFSAVLAGLAGALYVPQAGIINPSLLAPVFSIEMVVCVALGGRGTLYGAVLGAFLVNFAKSRLTGSYPDLWPFFLGLMFAASAVAGSGGLIKFLNPASWAGLIRRRRHGQPEI